MNDRDLKLPAGFRPFLSGQTGASSFVFSAAEQAAIVWILRDFPKAVQTLEASLRAILERLIPSCRGRLRTETDADYLLMGLADRVVARTISDEPDALRTTAVDLVTRHLLAGMRDEFHQRVLALGRGEGSKPPTRQV